MSTSSEREPGIEELRPSHVRMSIYPDIPKENHMEATIETCAACGNLESDHKPNCRHAPYIDKQAAMREQAHAFQNIVIGVGIGSGRHLSAVVGTDEVWMEECHAGKGGDETWASAKRSREGWTSADAHMVVMELLGEGSLTTHSWITTMSLDAREKALQTLADFAKTAPGRLPQRIQDALVVAAAAPQAGPVAGSHEPLMWALENLGPWGYEAAWPQPGRCRWCRAAAPGESFNDRNPDLHTDDCPWARFARVVQRLAPGEPQDALAYATNIAKHLWREHWSEVSPEWEPMGDLWGVLSQIDNMTTSRERNFAAAPDLAWQIRMIANGLADDPELADEVEVLREIADKIATGHMGATCTCSQYDNAECDECAGEPQASAPRDEEEIRCALLLLLEEAEGVKITKANGAEYTAFAVEKATELAARIAALRFAGKRPRMTLTELEAAYREDNQPQPTPTERFITGVIPTHGRIINANTSGAGAAPQEPNINVVSTEPKIDNTKPGEPQASAPRNVKRPPSTAAVIEEDRRRFIVTRNEHGSTVRTEGATTENRFAPPSRPDQIVYREKVEGTTCYDESDGAAPQEPDTEQ